MMMKRNKGQLVHRATALFTATVFIGLAGCAEYKAASVPLMVQEPPKSISRGGDYEVFVTTFSDPKKQETYFDADFQKAGLIALQLDVKNNAPEPVLVRKSTVALELPGGERMLATSPNMAAIHVGEEGSVIGATLAFGIIGGIAATQAEETARNARIADYESKGFKDARLGRGEASQGFVFFVPSKGTQPFDRTHLRVNFTDIATSRSQVVRTEVRGVNFVGRSDDDSTASTLPTEGPTQTYASADAVPASPIERTNRGNRLRKNRMRERPIDPTFENSRSKIEQKFERLMAPERRKRYKLACDKDEKKNQTQACQDVAYQIGLLEEAKQKELDRLQIEHRRQEARIRTQKRQSQPKKSPSLQPGSIINLQADRAAITGAIEDFLELNDGGDNCWGDINVVASVICSLVRLTNVKLGKVNSNKIEVTARYILEADQEERAFSGKFLLKKENNRYLLIEEMKI